MRIFVFSEATTSESESAAIFKCFGFSASIAHRCFTIVPRLHTMGIFRSKRCGARNNFLHQILTAGTIERRITLMKRTCLHCVIGKQGNFQFDTGIERCSTAQSFLAVILLLRLDIGTPVENTSCAFTNRRYPPSNAPRS